MARTFFIMLNNLQKMPLKIPQRKVFQKAAEATDDLIADRYYKSFKKLSQFRDDYDKEILKERYISLEERQKIINELRLT